MVSAKEIGSNVKELRRVKGFTQAQLAEAVGRSLHSISQIERGVNVPSVETLLALAAELSVPLDAIVSRGGVDESVDRNSKITRMIALLYTLDPVNLALAVQIVEILAKQSKR